VEPDFGDYPIVTVRLTRVGVKLVNLFAYIHVRMVDEYSNNIPTFFVSSTYSNGIRFLRISHGMPRNPHRHYTLNMRLNGFNSLAHDNIYNLLSQNPDENPDFFEMIVRSTSGSQVPPLVVLATLSTIFYERLGHPDHLK
jgi:hypothetical protein